MAKNIELTIGEFYNTNEYQVAAEQARQHFQEVNRLMKEVSNLYPEKDGLRWKINEEGVLYYGK